MSELILKNLTKYCQANILALEVPNLTVKSGELLVILGPKGGGKSTLLKLITGLEKATSGEIYLNGNLINNIPAKKRKVALVQQNLRLNPRKAINSNIVTSFKKSRFQWLDTHERVDSTAELLRLTNKLKQKPSLLLLDETLSNLDLDSRIELRQLLKRVQKQLKLTTIYATDNPIDAMALADRILILNNGLVQQIGTPLSLYDKPINTFVANILGFPRMNFMHGKLIPPHDFILEDETRLKLLGVWPALEQAYLGIRPENLIISSRGAIKAKPIDLEVLGEIALLYAKANNTILVAKVNPRSGIPEGDIRLDFEPRKAQIFNASVIGDPVRVEPLSTEN